MLRLLRQQTKLTLELNHFFKIFPQIKDLSTNVNVKEEVIGLQIKQYKKIHENVQIPQIHHF